MCAWTYRVIRAGLGGKASAVVGLKKSGEGSELDSDAMYRFIGQPCNPRERLAEES